MKAILVGVTSTVLLSASALFTFTAKGDPMPWPALLAGMNLPSTTQPFVINALATFNYPWRSPF